MLKQYAPHSQSVKDMLKIAAVYGFSFCSKFPNVHAQQLHVNLQGEGITRIDIHKDSVSLIHFIEQSRDTIWFDTYNRAKEQAIPQRYVGGQISHTYFRYYIREVLNKDNQIIKLFEQTYGGRGDSLRQYRYSLLFAKILDVYRSKKHKHHSFGIVYLPTEQFFKSLISTYSYDDLKKFTKQQGVDRSEVEDKLGKVDHGKTAFSTENITKYGLEFVPRNVVYDYCMNNGISIHSSLLGNKDNGESMHRYRTGLELRKESFEKLQKVTSLIQEDFGIDKEMIIISGGKEAGHGKDKDISHRKESFGKPLDKDDSYLYYQSHETGTCIDLAIRGESGLHLLDRLISHSTNKKEWALHKKMYFSYKGCEFSRMFHGDIPMGVHVHMRLMKR